MKQRIKQLILTLTLLSLLFSLCGCNFLRVQPKENETQRGTWLTLPEAETTTNTEAQTEATAPTESHESTAEVSFGTVNGNTYENSSIGLSCTLSDEWHIYTPSELALMNGIASDMLTEADLQYQLKTSGTAMDFYAAKDNGMTTVNITITDNGISLISAANEQAIVEAMLPTLESTYTSVGYKIQSFETETVEFAGGTHPCIVLIGSYNGLPIYMRQVMMLVDTYTITVSFGSFYEDKTTEAFDAFSPLT